MSLSNQDYFRCAQSVLPDWAQPVLAVAQGATPLILVLGVVAAITTAVVQVRSHRRTAARRATLQLISEREIHDPGMGEARRTFQRLRREVAPEQLPDHLDENPEDRLHVVKLLNHYELVAAGIRNGILDEPIYAAWGKSLIKRMWVDSQGVVSWMKAQRSARGEDPTKLYDQLEKLVTETWNDA